MVSPLSARLSSQNCQRDLGFRVGELVALNHRPRVGDRHDHDFDRFVLLGLGGARTQSFGDEKMQQLAAKAWCRVERPEPPQPFAAVAGLFDTLAPRAR
jgi:hypothetical protein